ncbi:MAG: hypothetical protein CVT82_04210 [Alphaproteobacteria bacterium HGW-Alphaproteobacteria-4]|jgi:hypothetical protein|nr:MAG: hypothetical protein CVT82_04210 [Alphaproteobacteria bacterium HGW-Alphaproteobacteria-4]
MIRHTWADEEEPQPRRRRYDPADERNLTFFEGRFFRRETSRHDPDNTITPAEQKVLHQHATEAAEARRADRDRAMTTLVQLGEALRVLED